MKKRPSRKPQATKTSRSKRHGLTIGRERFAKISAVEGITLSKAMTTRIREFDRRGNSAAERRTLIIGAYRKS